MLVLAIETSTPQTTVSIGTEQGVMGSVLLSWGRGHSEIITPAIARLLEWTELRLPQVGGVADRGGDGREARRGLLRLLPADARRCGPGDGGRRRPPPAPGRGAGGVGRG